MASPFLAVSLDAVNHAADLGRASGLTEEAAGWGLVRMWAHAFRSKVDVVTPHQVSGFFGGDVARVAVALMAFGFLEAVGEAFRVKGADRYLRLHEARRKGGLAAKKHLVPGARHSLGSSREAAERQPEVQPGSLSALTPITDHRSPREEETTLSADADPPAFSPKDLQALYNVHAIRAGWAKWDAMGENRRRPALARLREHPERAWWESVLLRAAKSAFLRGENDRGWRMEPDFFVRVGRAESILEGKYDGGHGGKVGTTTPERKVTVL